MTDKGFGKAIISRCMLLRMMLAMICSGIAPATLVQAQQSELEEIVARYNAMHAKIGDEYSADILSALDRYGRSVDALAKQAQSQGDLETVLSLMSEAKRFKAEKNVPDNDDDDLNPLLSKLRQGYRLAIQEADEKRAVSLPALQDSYVKRLDAMKRQLTKDGKLEEALAVKAEIDRVNGGLDTVIIKGVNSNRDRTNRTRDVPPESYDPFLDESDTPGRLMDASPESSDPEPSARQKFLDRHNERRNAGRSSTRRGNSESLTEGIDRYRDAINSMADKFSRGESEVAKLSTVTSDPSAYKGRVIRSGVYLVSAFARGVTVSSTSGGKNTVEMLPYTLDAGKDAENVFNAIGAGGRAVVTYGVVSEDNITLFALDSL